MTRKMTPSNTYSRDYYEDRGSRTALAARTVLSEVESVIGKIRSAADFGCGVGTWLDYLLRSGATKVYGFDGAWVDRELLQIPASNFAVADIPDVSVSFQEKLDLAICLEVAEHIDPSRAEDLVDLLAKTADTVLFGAAIPHQEGRGHVNLQPPEFWADKFRGRGFLVYDIIRGRIWGIEGISYWYKQNTILFSRKPLALPATTGHCLHLVHPDLLNGRIASYVEKIDKLQSFRGAARALKAALKRGLRSTIAKK